MITKEGIAGWFMGLQDAICTALEKEDGGAVFRQDIWERPEGGGGRTRIIRNGSVIEKGGVNFSAVHGAIPAFLHREGDEGAEFFATGVSIVIHPSNPMVPIIHMNVRYFETTPDNWWFGGGIDLTPHYVDESDAMFFHQSLRKTCETHGSEYYDRFSKWADDYFYIPHRGETRGIGGIFFDRLNTSSEKKSKQEIFDFVRAVGETFAPVYCALMRKNKDKPFTEDHKKWQLVRRGRYVEFNLVYDKGTKFGLETNGRIESILMSLPALAAWEYDLQPEPGSPEQHTLSLLTKGRKWAVATS